MNFITEGSLKSGKMDDGCSKRIIKSSSIKGNKLISCWSLKSGKKETRRETSKMSKTSKTNKTNKTSETSKANKTSKTKRQERQVRQKDKKDE